jgi:hypothetical protein
MFDLQVQKFKDDVINVINESGLPLSMIGYVLADVAGMVKASLDVELEKQKQQSEAEVAED